MFSTHSSAVHHSLDWKHSLYAIKLQSKRYSTLSCDWLEYLDILWSCLCLLDRIVHTVGTYSHYQSRRESEHWNQLSWVWEWPRYFADRCVTNSLIYYSQSCKGKSHKKIFLSFPPSHVSSPNVSCDKWWCPWENASCWNIWCKERPLFSICADRFSFGIILCLPKTAYVKLMLRSTICRLDKLRWTRCSILWGEASHG